MILSYVFFDDNDANDLYFVFQGKYPKDNTPYGDYGGWHKAAKVDRSATLR